MNFPWSCAAVWDVPHVTMLWHHSWVFSYAHSYLQTMSDMLIWLGPVQKCLMRMVDLGKKLWITSAICAKNVWFVREPFGGRFAQFPGNVYIIMKTSTNALAPFSAKLLVKVTPKPSSQVKKVDSVLRWLGLSNHLIFILFICEDSIFHCAHMCQLLYIMLFPLCVN